ncbi:hypothetical protein B0H17DRAFT_1140998 [Mycena rosella]|uniref:Uncharacterized protein n=1 Tax=Mycena rosella TaxID=1033263 RepID=A0AAD7D4L0_MYCRO|nr:hypothetical protein B0H17DRAFT_1140998 [Mycena rosella]
MVSPRVLRIGASRCLNQSSLCVEVDSSFSASHQYGIQEFQLDNFNFRGDDLEAAHRCASMIQPSARRCRAQVVGTSIFSTRWNRDMRVRFELKYHSESLTWIERVWACCVVGSPHLRRSLALKGLMAPDKYFMHGLEFGVLATHQREIQNSTKD